jgi:hypothetical protein
MDQICKNMVVIVLEPVIGCFRNSRLQPALLFSCFSAGNNANSATIVKSPPKNTSPSPTEDDTKRRLNEAIIAVTEKEYGNDIAVADIDAAGAVTISPLDTLYGTARKKGPGFGLGSIKEDAKLELAARIAEFVIQRATLAAFSGDRCRATCTQYA